MDREPNRPAFAASAARRRRRLRRLSVTIGVAAAVVILLGIAVGTSMRTFGAQGFSFGAPEVRVIATPKDARVVFVGSDPATETAYPAQLAPGTYLVKVTRKGYVSEQREVRIRRGKNDPISITLEPKPVKLTLDLRPESARYAITCSDGTSKSGSGGFSGTVPAGPTKVRITSKGCKPVTRSVFLESPAEIVEWLDPSGQIVHRLGEFETVPAPKGVAITPDDREIWTTALVTQPSILIQDPRTGKKLGGIDLGGSGAVEVVFNEDGSRAYASQMQSASVFEIDTASRKVLRRFKTDSSWTKIVHVAPDGKTLYAANWSGDDISVISLAKGKTVKRIPTVDTPRGCWPTADGKRLFVAGFGENSGVGRLAVIDLATGKQKVFYQKRGAAMRHMIADEKRGLLFTSDLGQDCILVTDMKTLKTKKFIETDRKPNTIDLSPDGRVLFVSCRGENNPKSYYVPGPEWGTVLLFDAKTGTPLDAIIGGNQCTALDLSPDGKLLVFSDFLDAKLHVYEVPPFDVLARGKGGRYLAHFDEIVRPGWDGWAGPKPPSGN